jgi:hypothetical protein
MSDSTSHLLWNYIPAFCHIVYLNISYDFISCKMLNTWSVHWQRNVFSVRQKLNLPTKFGRILVFKETKINTRAQISTQIEISILYRACLSIFQNHRHPYAFIIFSEIFDEHFSVSRKLKEKSTLRSSDSVCYFVLEFNPLESQFWTNCLHVKSYFSIQHSHSSSHSTLI